MSENRILRYRRIAMAEKDPASAKLLRQLADEAERGILCIAERRTRGNPTSLPIGADPET